MNSFTQRVFLVFMCASWVALGGCGGLLDPGPPPSVYQLAPELPAKANAQKMNLQLAVVQPTANEMLSTNRVVTRYANGEVRTWKGVAWVAPTPVMVQRFLVEAYEEVDLFTAMSYDALGYNADYRLISDLREFTVVLNDADKADHVEVQLNAHLIDLQGGRSIGSLNSRKTVRIDGSGFDGVLAAFNSASSACVREVCDWSVELLRKINRLHNQ